VDERPAAGTPLPPEQAPRRYPSTIGGALYLFALLGVAVGLIVVVLADWRVGVRCIGGALLFGATCRLLLPTHHAGMLAVRSRFTDVALLVAMGVTIIVLAGSIPNQPL
jgi:hypothetical protein